MKNQKYVFLMTVVIETEDGNIRIEEKGDVLENFTLKKDFKTVLMALLKTKKDIVAGKTLPVDISIEKNGEYFDHDEIFITLNNKVDDFAIEM